MESRIPKQLAKIAEIYLQKGVTFSEAALNIIKLEMREIEGMGADKLYVIGWIGGFNTEPEIKEYMVDEKYIEGYKGGKELRKELEKRYIN